MTTEAWTEHDHVSQGVGSGRSHAPSEGLARTLLDICAECAVLFSAWLLF